MNQYPAHFHDWPEFLGSAEVASILHVNRFLDWVRGEQS